MNFILLLMIAVSLSMDAFSLSLAYGTLDLSKKDIITLTIIVGLFHFFMPIIGNSIGSMLLKFFPVSPNFIVSIVLMFIGVEMILDSKNEEKVKKMSYIEYFLFGFAVSIDSFSVGLGLISITDLVIFAALLFCFCSAFFTFLGLNLGTKIHKKIGSVATLLGGIALIIIGIFYLF